MNLIMVTLINGESFLISPNDVSYSPSFMEAECQYELYQRIDGSMYHGKIEGKVYLSIEHIVSMEVITVV